MINIKKILSVSMVIIFSVLFIAFARETAESAIKSINTCINVIVPSMFAFMVISSYVLSSGIYKALFKPLYLTVGRLFKLDEKSFSIFLLSLVGGYPVGIKLLKEAIAQNKNYSAIADKTTIFCYCISPTFAITMIGLGIFNSAEIGIIVYASNAVSCMITAFVLSRIYNLRNDKTITQVKKSGIVESVNGSSSALFKICSMIVFFNAGISSLNSLLNCAEITLPTLLTAIFEISNILDFKPEIAQLPLISAISSMGGICVILQCYSIAEGVIPFKKFIIARIPIAVISGLITSIIIKFCRISIPAFAGIGNYSFEFNSNKTVVIFLIIICTILLQNNEKNFKKG